LIPADASEVVRHRLPCEPHALKASSDQSAHRTIAHAFDEQGGCPRLRGDTGSYAIHDREAGTVEQRAIDERQAS
jgi:hypothetical protein